MMKYRSVLSVILAAIAVFLVSCSSPAPKVQGPTYTPQQLEQIQNYLADVKELRDRLLEIPPMVQKQEWVDVQTFIHGPLGELRFKMGKLARSLEPKLQKPALAAAQEVFEHLILIDEATQTRDSRKALFNYNQTLKDFDAFLSLVPQQAS
jgi:photosystem II protein PsbQ